MSLDKKLELCINTPALTNDFLISKNDISDITSIDSLNTRFINTLLKHKDFKHLKVNNDTYDPNLVKLIYILLFQKVLIFNINKLTKEVDIDANNRLNLIRQGFLEKALDNYFKKVKNPLDRDRHPADLDTGFHTFNNFNALTNELPVGRFKDKIIQPYKNFYKLLQVFSKGFLTIYENFNFVIKGILQFSNNSIDHIWRLVKSESNDQILKTWLDLYNLPNNIFYISNEDNSIDIFVIRFLMRGNTRWHFKMIAKIYELDIDIEYSNEFYFKNRFPYRFVFRFEPFFKKLLNIVFIRFKRNDNNQRIEKVKKIFEFIKPIGMNIKYLRPSDKIVKDDQIYLEKNIFKKKYFN